MENYTYQLSLTNVRQPRKFKGEGYNSLSRTGHDHAETGDGGTFSGFFRQRLKPFPQPALAVSWLPDDDPYVGAYNGISRRYA